MWRKLEMEGGMKLNAQHASISSSELNQDTNRALKIALNGPVFITDQDQPTHVLLSIADYQQMAGKQANIVDLLAMDDDIALDFEPSRVSQMQIKRST
jgi:hypothetical protein